MQEVEDIGSCNQDLNTTTITCKIAPDMLFVFPVGETLLA
jgi:hypothetical protein